MDTKNKSLFDFVVRDGNGVKGVADSGVTELPELYIQPPCERIDHKINTYLLDKNLPIDISHLNQTGPNHDQVMKQIANAAEKFGFFQVINHGVSLELMESLKNAAHMFFDRPREEKVVYLKGASVDQLVVYGTSFAPAVETALEWKDQVTMSHTNDDDDALQHWPNECAESSLEYLKKCNIVAKTIFNALMVNLGVTMDEARVDALLGSKKVSMNFYPKCPSPELTIGAGRHTDSGSITVLLQDTIGGLYVRIEEDMDDGKKKGDWMEIPPIHGALVINIGDTLEILSNGRYRSAEHRVQASNKQSRVSVPFFALPLASEPVGPLHEVVETTGGIAHYREFEFGEYTRFKFGKIHDGKNTLHGFAQINQLS